MISRSGNLEKNLFLAGFPDKISLKTFTRLSGLELSLFGLKVRIEKSAADSETSSVLQTVWIKIHRAPVIARQVDIVKEIAALVAEPLVVDELSLIRDEPVRFQGRCRNPDAIRGSIEYFFNGVGVPLGFEVEKPQTGFKGGKGGPPGPGKPEDSHKRDPDYNHKDGKGKRSQDKFDRFGRIDKDMDSGHDDSMEEGLEKR